MTKRKIFGIEIEIAPARWAMGIVVAVFAVLVLLGLFDIGLSNQRNESYDSPKAQATVFGRSRSEDFSKEYDATRGYSIDVATVRVETKFLQTRCKIGESYSRLTSIEKTEDKVSFEGRVVTRNMSGATCRAKIKVSFIERQSILKFIADEIWPF